MKTHLSVIAVLLLTLPHAMQARADLAVSAAQRDALGIEARPLEASATISRPLLPARVLIPNDESLLIAIRTTGVVQTLRVSTGDPVTQGQLLSLVESPAYMVLQREYLEALSRRDLARSTFERERQLADEGIIAGRRAIDSEARLRESQILVDERGHGLRLIGMDASELRTLGRSRKLQPELSVRAPVSGVVLEQRAHVGQRLDAGSVLYRIGRLDTLHIEIHAPLEVTNRLHRGSRFTIAGTDAEGHVIAIGREVHALDQGVLVRGELDTGFAALRPGQFVQVELQIEDITASTFDVPNTALARVNQRTFVFRQIDGGFEPIPVEIVGGSGRSTAITGPISAGDELVVRGTAALKAYWLSQKGAD